MRYTVFFGTLEQGTIIINQNETDSLYDFFKTTKFSYFIRQLTLTGFTKVIFSAFLELFFLFYFIDFN